MLRPNELILLKPYRIQVSNFGCSPMEILDYIEYNSCHDQSWKTDLCRKHPFELKLPKLNRHCKHKNYVVQSLLKDKVLLARKKKAKREALERKRRAARSKNGGLSNQNIINMVKLLYKKVKDEEAEDRCLELEARAKELCKEINQLEEDKKDLMTKLKEVLFQESQQKQEEEAKRAVFPNTPTSVPQASIMPLNNPPGKAQYDPHRMNYPMEGPQRQQMMSNVRRPRMGPHNGRHPRDFKPSVNGPRVPRSPRDSYRPREPPHRIPESREHQLTPPHRIPEPREPLHIPDSREPPHRVPEPRHHRIPEPVDAPFHSRPRDHPHRVPDPRRDVRTSPPRRDPYFRAPRDPLIRHPSREPPHHIPKQHHARHPSREPPHRIPKQHHARHPSREPPHRVPREPAHGVPHPSREPPHRIPREPRPISPRHPHPSREPPHPSQEPPHPSREPPHKIPRDNRHISPRRSRSSHRGRIPPRNSPPHRGDVHIRGMGRRGRGSRRGRPRSRGPPRNGYRRSQRYESLENSPREEGEYREPIKHRSPSRKRSSYDNRSSTFGSAMHERTSKRPYSPHQSTSNFKGPDPSIRDGYRGRGPSRSRGYN